MSFALQWTRDGVAINGATSAAYQITSLDLGKTLAFRVTATNDAGSTTAVSTGVFVPSSGPALAISGTIPSTGVVGQSYASTCSASGGEPPYAFSMPSGTPPSGTTFSTSTGIISGVLTTPQVKTGIIIRVTDHAGATADLPSSGSASITVAASGTPVTPGTIDAAVAAASPGAILSMQPGDYTSIDWFGINKAAPGIVLQGQSGVHLAFIATNTCSGLTFTGITVTGLRTGQYACYGANSDRIVFDSLTLPGSNPGGVHPGVGIFFRDCTNVAATNNAITQHGDGIDALDVTNITTSGNNITKVSANFIFQTSVHNALIEKNYLANLDFLDPGAHPDAVQLASTGAARSNTVTIRYNNFDALTGDTTVQGPGGSCENVDGLTIVTNCQFGSSDNGIVASGCTNVSIGNNYAQAWVYSPRIYCRDGCDGVDMTGNFSAILPFSLATIPPNQNVHIGVNTAIPQATSGSDTSRRNTYLQSNPLIPVS